MSILCAGLTYEHVPIGVLERLAVPDEQRPDLLRRLRDAPGVDGVFLLATCNRLEFYADGDTRAPAALERALDWHPLVRREVCAVEHLCSVAGGLESMALGEREIAGQLRRAVRAAAESMSPELHRLVRTALRAGRRVRAETDLGTAGLSLAGAGMDLAVRYLHGLAGRAVLVIGAGEVGRAVARRARALGAGRILIANRGRTAADRLAAEVGGVVAGDLSQGPLPRCDLMVTAVRAPEPVVTAGRVTGPAFVLDLGLPRNVAPEVRTLPGVRVADIEDLGRHLAGRGLPEEVERARAIVAEEVAAHLTEGHERAAVPLITALRGQAGQVVADEVVRLHRRLPGLDERARRETETAIRRVAGRLLHEPTIRAKRLSATPGGARYLDALAHLYGLEETT
ncbi:glutamyl-tRNA reductase [Nonomuraea typhae]|uniref:glutamyl-tRNA reductase n=1 Tax=Nonomuraea typhae TaxID=2603600 RepID=UPI0012FAC762|nr:glutamyl-tRNA reductase [Nonomuraea typhae]